MCGIVEWPGPSRAYDAWGTSRLASATLFLFAESDARRYYSSADRMTNLFVKITNQMISNCREYIRKPGRLWDQDALTVVQRLSLCLKLNEAYQEQYAVQKEKLALQPKVGTVVHYCK